MSLCLSYLIPSYHTEYVAVPLPFEISISCSRLNVARDYDMMVSLEVCNMSDKYCCAWSVNSINLLLKNGQFFHLFFLVKYK